MPERFLYAIAYKSSYWGSPAPKGGWNQIVLIAFKSEGKCQKKAMPSVYFLSSSSACRTIGASMNRDLCWCFVIRKFLIILIFFSLLCSLTF